MTDTSRVTTADLPDLLPLVRGYCDFYEVAPSDDALLAVSRALIADPDREGMQLIARGDSRDAVGFATVYWSWNTLIATRVGIMHDLFVVPPARGTGVADLLISACVDECRKHGATSWAGRRPRTTRAHNGSTSASAQHARSGWTIGSASIQKLREALARLLEPDPTVELVRVLATRCRRQEEQHTAARTRFRLHRVDERTTYAFTAVRLVHDERADLRRRPFVLDRRRGM